MRDREESEHTLFAIPIVMPMRDLIVEPDRDIRRPTIVLVRLIIRDIFFERSFVLLRERISGDLDLLAGYGVSASASDSWLADRIKMSRRRDSDQ